MAQLEIVRSNKPWKFLLSRLRVVFFAAVMSMTSTANVFAQQKEINDMNQPGTAAATKPAAADAIRPLAVLDSGLPCFYKGDTQ